jgi:hypothetical protein
MVKVVDPEGVRWTVRRRWWSAIPWETGFDSVDALIFVIMLPFMALWPFWLLAKWLGVSWTIVVHRDGERVAREKVRGWRASGRRIAELASQAQDGALTTPVMLTEQQ